MLPRFRLLRAAMDCSHKFWDRIANRYSAQPVADEASYQRKLEVTREYLRPDMTVFEFGCGTGSTAIAHSPFVRRITAIDVSEKMIEIARSKAQAEGVTNVVFEQSTIDAFSGDPASFDAVLGLSILHLVEDRERVIRKVYGLLKPGGVFVSSTACLGGTPWRFIKYVAPLGRVFGLLPMVKSFSPKELEQSLVSAGFSIGHRWQPGDGMVVFVVATKSS